MKSPVAMFLGLVLILTGCATTRVPEPADVETKLSAVAPLNVRAAPAVWAYADDFKAAGLPFRYETGRSFVKVFAGTAADVPVIEIVSTALTSEMKNLGFAIDYVYDVTIRLTDKGQSREISAHANYRSTGFDGPAPAAKIVTEDAIAQLASQVRAITGK
jgi:hypothetical protein